MGSSTGGFTDVLLSRGAARVYAVDSGTNQLAWKLRQDERVIVHEQTSARVLTAAHIPEPIDLVVCDASFIGLAKVLEVPLGFVRPGGRLLALIKPQFEAGREEVGKGGVVRDPDVHARVCAEVAEWLERERLDGDRHHAKPDHRARRQRRVPDRRHETGLIRRKSLFAARRKSVTRSAEVIASTRVIGGTCRVELASKEQLRASYLRWAVVTVPFILLLGFTSGRLVPTGSENCWYAALVKPAETPPDIAFPIAWTTIYVLMGLAVAMIVNARGSKLRGPAIGLFAAQLVVNLAWSPLFFGAHQVFWSLIDDRRDAGAGDCHYDRVRAHSQGRGVADGAVSGVDQLCGCADVADHGVESERRQPCLFARRAPRSRSEYFRSNDMQSQNRFFDDLVKVFNGAAGTVAGVGREAEASARSRAREWIGGLDFVSREEFEAVKAMAVAARDENDALRARLDKLEQGAKPARAARSASVPQPPNSFSTAFSAGRLRPRCGRDTQ